MTEQFKELVMSNSGQIMNTATSISGGKTSAYMAVNYQTDFNVFALVRTDSKNCEFKDRRLAKMVEDRIQKPFIGTLEDDTIIHTIFDLEQFLGKQIHWVSGSTFDDVVKYGGGWLPNKLHRYCTSMLKIEPIFYWWAELIGEPIKMNIGFRAGENNRVKKHRLKCNKNGLIEFKATFEKHKKGRHEGKNKWENIEWQFPNYPLFEDQIFKWEIENFWAGINKVRFAEINNCTGCFHKKIVTLKKQYMKHPNKIQWFADQEGGKKGYWRSDASYKKIINLPLQYELSFDDNDSCESGYCGI